MALSCSGPIASFGMLTGTYSPPSGASPCRTACEAVTGASADLVLLYNISVWSFICLYLAGKIANVF